MPSPRQNAWTDLESRPRRTVTITGRPGASTAPVRRLRDVSTTTSATEYAPTPRPRVLAVDRRRPARPVTERVSARPDRIALYAFLMGLFLVLVTLLSAHGA
jgi:hypothetical protein